MKLARLAVLGLATFALVGAAEAMPVASTSVPAAPVVKSAVVVTKVIRRRPVVRRRVIVRKVIR